MWRLTFFGNGLGSLWKSKHSSLNDYYIDMRWHAWSVLLLGFLPTLCKFVKHGSSGGTRGTSCLWTSPCFVLVASEKNKTVFQQSGKITPQPQSWSVQIIFFDALCGDQPDQAEPYWGLDHTYVGVCSSSREVAFSVQFGFSSTLKPELLVKFLPRWRFFEVSAWFFCVYLKSVFFWLVAFVLRHLLCKMFVCSAFFPEATAINGRRKLCVRLHVDDIVLKYH